MMADRSLLSALRGDTLGTLVRPVDAGKPGVTAAAAHGPRTRTSASDVDVAFVSSWATMPMPRT